MPPIADAAVPQLTARTIAVAGALFVMTAAFVLTKTGRDALYFQGRGLYDLPMAYMGIALLALPLALSVLVMMRAIGPRRARVLLPLLVAALLLAFQPVARPGGGVTMTLFFMLVPLVFGVMFSLSWLLAADLLDGAVRRDLARSYSAIGGASIVGGVAGALVAKAVAMRIEPSWFLAFGASGLVLASGVMAVAQRTFPPRALRQAAAVNTKPGQFRVVLRQRYTALLLASAAAAALAGVLIEFQFYLTAATSGNGGRDNANFFASAYLGLNLIALFIQLFLVPLLQRRVGVHGSLLVLPGALLGGSAMLMASASMVSRSILRVAEGGLKSSVHRSSWEQAYLPLALTQRAVAKLLVDGAGARLTEGFAAVALYAWLRFGIGARTLTSRDIAWVPFLLLGTSVLWIALTRGLGRTLARACAAIGAADEFRADVPLADT